MRFICGMDEEFLKILVNAVNSVISEDISLDLMRAGLQKNKANSYPTRIWDLINSQIINQFDRDPDVIARFTKRGPWNLIAIFHKTSGVLFTIMREERFIQIRKDKKINHYVAQLAFLFNNEFQINQQSFFPMDFNEHEVALSVDRICEDLSISKDMVTNHAIILFSAKNEMISSIRLVMVNCNFEECASFSLNHLIRVEPSVIVDQVDNNDINDAPGISLKFKEKAKIKQGLNHAINLKDDDKSEKHGTN